LAAIVLLAGSVLFFAGGSAKADFKLYVFDDGVLTNTFSVASGGTIDTGEFNTTHFHIGRTLAPGVDLGIVAQSNSPGTPARAFINQLTYLAFNTGSGVHTLTVAASDVGFTQPAGTLVLRNAVNVTWGEGGSGTSTADNLSFTSYVNTLNKQFDSDVDPTAPGQVGNAASGNFASTTLTLNANGLVGTTGSANSPDVNFSNSGLPYSISDMLTLTLNAGDGAEVNGVSNVFPRAFATPAPGGLVALATCVPLIGVVTWLRRRRPTML